MQPDRELREQEELSQVLEEVREGIDSAGKLWDTEGSSPALLDYTHEAAVVNALARAEEILDTLSAENTEEKRQGYDTGIPAIGSGTSSPVTFHSATEEAGERRWPDGSTEPLELWFCPKHGPIGDEWLVTIYSDEDEDHIWNGCGLCPRDQAWGEDELKGPVFVIPVPEAAQAERLTDEEISFLRGAIVHVVAENDYPRIAKDALVEVDSKLRSMLASPTDTEVEDG